VQKKSAIYYCYYQKRQKRKTFKKMVIDTKCEDIGATAKNVLSLASLECRVVMGLPAAVKSLSKTPEDYLFCFITPPQKGDCVSHMNEVLLEAFCLENDIYIIKVDSPTKLSRLLGCTELQSCALIQKSWDPLQEAELLTDAEDALVDFCEEHWMVPAKPVVKLPEK
jgi:growth arrest and DNA-damage-inducible protein